jgi:hypothetical protein
MRWIFGAVRNLFRAENDGPRDEAHLQVEILEDRVTPAGDFRSVIGLDAVQNLYPYRGQGYSVAILDTGIDYNHADLGGGFGAGKRVIAGYDFINNDADPMDDHGHGTHLAGIIGSSNANAPGIAPNVNLIALKVLDSSNNGNWTAVDNALKWVISHRDQYNIVGVNLSLGSGNYTTNPYTLLENDFAALENLGVFTAVAAGNRFYTFGSQPGIGYPSISPNVVSVGATWAGDFGPANFSTGAADYSTAVDRIASFTQRGSNLSLMAPGTWITSTWLGGGTKTMGGSSMATAVVTGSAVLLHEAYDNTGKASQATQDNLLALMKSTGATVIDGDDENDNVTNTGLSFKRLNLKAAMDTVGQPNGKPTLAAIANQTLQVGQTIYVPLQASDPENEPITFTYKQIYLPAQAYQLDQQLGLTSSGNYYTNSRGANEKWMIGNNQVWYCVMPNGEVRRWTGTMTDTLLPTNLVATFDASYYADPAKLWNAPYAGMPPAVFGITGNTLSIRSPAQWLGTYQLEVTASDGHYQVKRLFNVTVTPSNAAPVLSAIANQTMSHAQDSITLGLSATDANNDPLTFSAQVLPTNGVQPAVSVTVQGNQLTVNPAVSVVGTFTVQANVSDGKAIASRTFTVTVNNAAPTLSAIADRTASHGVDTVIALSGSDSDGDALIYSARVLPINGQTPSISATVLGNQLTLHPTQPIVGTFAIEASVSDGAVSATRTFNLTLTNAGPEMAAIGNVTFAAGQTSANVSVSATDADQDSLTFQAVALTPSALAYQLDQQYGFRAAAANYYLNLQGKNEKWLVSQTNVWYTLLPTGQLYRWAGTMAQTLQSANLVATFDASFYAEPRLLWDARPAVAPALTFIWQGNQLTIQRASTLTGVYFIDVSATDGWLTTKRTMQVTLN